MLTIKHNKATAEQKANFIERVKQLKKLADELNLSIFGDDYYGAYIDDDLSESTIDWGDTPTVENVRPTEYGD